MTGFDSVGESQARCPRGRPCPGHPAKRPAPGFDKSDLAANEAVIERGLATFVEVGNALLAIRDGRLYRESHDTFEAYCRERWDFNDSRARQLISAAETAAIVTSGNGPAPSNERQIRELRKLPADEQADAWSEVVESAPERDDGTPKVTAKQVESVVSRRLGC